MTANTHTSRIAPAALPIIILAVLSLLKACVQAADADRVGSAAETERPVARSATAVLPESAVRCHPRMRAADVEGCRRAEATNVRLWIYRQAIPCAARMRGLALTAAEERSAEAKIDAERELMERVVARHRTLLRGVLRIQEGEDSDSVTMELKGSGIHPLEVEERLQHHKTAADTRRALDADHLAAIHAATRESIRGELLFVKLLAHVQERAKVSGRPREEEEATLWRAAIAECKLEVVDARYEMPNFKGVFEKNVSTVRGN